MTNKAIVIMFRNFVNQTHSLLITPKDEETWRMLLTLKSGLIDAIAWMETINTMDWCSVYTTDLSGREQIKVTCINRNKAYDFYLPNQLWLTQALNRIIDGMKVSKIIGVDDKVKIGDEIEEWSYSGMTPIARLHEPLPTERYIPDIIRVIQNSPATIVFWSDGTKTVVKAKNEVFDPEKGFAMAISKKALGNKGNYYETFKKLEPVVRRCAVDFLYYEDDNLRLSKETSKRTGAKSIVVLFKLTGQIFRIHSTLNTKGYVRVVGKISTDYNIVYKDDIPNEFVRALGKAYRELRNE